MPAGEAEIARARLLPLAPAGFEEVERGDELELAVYAESVAEERMRAVFPDAASSPVAPGWADRWRAFHRPVRAGGLWIGPPWEPSPAGEVAVVVDPGRAFGTGGHPTTRACIELLSGVARGSLLDAGCGSGVLAVAGARLGFEPVFAVHHDPAAVETAERTAQANGVHVSVSAADLDADELPRVDVVVANIELRAVEALLARRPAPTAVTSGYLTGDVPSAAGWERAERMELEGWAADVLVAK